MKSSVVNLDSLNPDPDTNLGFWWLKNEDEKKQLKEKFIFFDQKLQFTSPKASIKDVQATGEAFSPHKRTSGISKI